MPAHEFRISVGDLDAAGRAHAFPVRAAWVRGVLEGNEATASDTDGKLEVRASKSGNDVVVHGTLKAALTVPCARCLEPVQIPIDHPVTVLMVPGSAGHAGHAGHAGTDEHELTAEEADTYPYDGESVVLDDFIRDELVLDIPMIPLCSEDCPGMRPPPSQDPDPKSPSPKQASPAGQHAIDPRLLPLMRFKAKE